jgi:hypothetical protein
MENEEDNKQETPATVTLTKEQFEALVGKKEEKKESIADEAIKRLENEKKEKEETAEIEDAIKFNLSISEFVSKNKNILPDETENIIKTAEERNFKNSSEKANAIRKGIIEAFVKYKENVEKLPQSIQAEVARFNSFTEREKEAQSKRFWSIVEVGAEYKILSRKAEQLQNNGGYGAAENSAFEQRFLEQGKIFRKG